MGFSFGLRKPRESAATRSMKADPGEGVISLGPAGRDAPIARTRATRAHRTDLRDQFERRVLWRSLWRGVGTSDSRPMGPRTSLVTSGLRSSSFPGPSRQLRGWPAERGCGPSTASPRAWQPNCRPPAGHYRSELLETDTTRSECSRQLRTDARAARRPHHTVRAGARRPTAQASHSTRRSSARAGARSRPHLQVRATARAEPSPTTAQLLTG